jgi:hypothetical protein
MAKRMQVVLDERQVIGVSDECADLTFKIFKSPIFLD